MPALGSAPSPEMVADGGAGLQDTPLPNRACQPGRKVGPGPTGRLPPAVVQLTSGRCRDFVMSMYQELKKANPKLPILVRECEGVTPKLIARYGTSQPLCRVAGALCPYSRGLWAQTLALRRPWLLTASTRRPSPRNWSSW